MILGEIKNIYVPVLQQIEYLEVNSDHQQYIDTEIKCSSNMTFDLNIYIPQYTARAFWCFGGRDMKIYVNSIHMAYLNDSDHQKKVWRYGNFECLQDGFLGKGWHRFQNNSSGTLMIDNSINLVTETSTFSTDINFYLLTLNVYNTPALSNTAPGARIKQSKIYISNILVRDFIPVRVGSVGYLYDRVSKRLFGNKGTGNFVLGQDVDSGLQQIYQNRLIEGVDYETYDWLRANIPITTTMMQLPINSRIFEFKRNFLQLMNSDYFNTSNDSENPAYNYFITDYSGGGTGNRHPRIWDISNSSVVYTSPTSVNFGVIHTIVANSDEIMIKDGTNTASLPWYGNPFKIKFNNSVNENKNTVHLTSPIKVDGVTRYVPCQLLRSIPRNLDAQCIARQAGECGMIDMISGKFYGNVANSGTFTVENDNN